MKAKMEELLQWRSNFRQTLSKEVGKKFPAVLVEGSQTLGPKQVLFSGNTSFEELKCISYRPENGTLHATVKLKRPSGYNGNWCSNGSREYVRFYIDYHDDGTWKDVGANSFSAHDLGFKEDLCYDITLPIKPEKLTCCKNPQLPRVRAILSWNLLPPANSPNWMPFWGNRLESNIQLQSLHPLFCQILDVNTLFTEKLELPVLEEINTVLEKASLPEKPEFSIAQEVELLRKFDVEETRFTYPQVQAYLSQEMSFQGTELAFPQEYKIKKVDKLIDSVLKLKFNKQYEELTCVSLNRDMSILNATVRIKRPYGYSGNLCQGGGKEFVAFYMDFGGGWEYMGTENVEVYNFTTIPADGLTYNVSLPVNLDGRRKAWCEAGKAKLKGILSWNSPPPPFQPDYIASWGDWELCHVEIKPLPRDVHPGGPSLCLETLGGMSVLDINQITGLANGLSANGLWSATHAPFDGGIQLTGELINGGSVAWQYRIMVDEPDALPRPLLDKVTFRLSGFGPYVTLTPDSNGWMPYTSFILNQLGTYRPTKEGIHQIWVELRHPVTHVVSACGGVKFRINKTTPDVDVEITSGMGNCGKFEIGTPVSGTYKIVGRYLARANFNITPHPESNPGVITTDDGGTTGVGSQSFAFPGTSVGTSLVGRNWSLNTGGMPPCGYNIRLRVVERTIINSGSTRRERGDIEGFCVTPAVEKVQEA
jgi:hypothetical protein